MLTPYNYSSILLKESNNPAETVGWVDALANLVLAKKTILGNIKTSELTTILASLKCPKAIQNILLIMIENNDTSLLPRIAAGLRRQLTKIGKPVADVYVARSDKMTENKIGTALGSNYTVVFQSDPKLIAGMRISSANFTYESSVASRLDDMKKALNN